jgi:methionyl-tRNA formyltransferase
MRIVFFGSADFGIPALQQLKKEHTVCAVVSTPPKPQGRGLKISDSPIVVFARQHGLVPIFAPARMDDQNFYRDLIKCRADIFIVVAFRILPKALFSIPPLGTLNIHASLLPKYRGPAPIQRAIEAGERETGITIFRIDEGIDTGGILLQKKVPISNNETTIELYSRLSELGAKGLIESLDGIQRGDLQPRSQDITQSSRAPKLKKEEALINWRQSAVAVYNKIRAFKPFPGTYTEFDGKRLGIERAEPVENDPPDEPGTIVAIKDSFFDVRCSLGVLRVFEVKPEGRRSMNVHDFLLGNRIREGKRFS